MVATVPTVAYVGLEARSVELQASLIAGLPAFTAPFPVIPGRKF